MNTLRGGPSHRLPAPIAVKRTEDEGGRFLVLAAYENDQDSRRACQTLEGFPTSWGKKHMRVHADYRGKALAGEFLWGTVTANKAAALHDQRHQPPPPVSSPLAMRISPSEACSGAADSSQGRA